MFRRQIFKKKCSGGRYLKTCSGGRLKKNMFRSRLKKCWAQLGSFLSEMKACRPFHRIALIDFLSGASFSSKMAHRTAELWTFENSMFDFGSCCKVLGHKTITTGFSSKNHAQRWHWRPKLPTRTDRQCRLKNIPAHRANLF